MGIFARLFGRGKKAEAGTESHREEEHETDQVNVMDPFGGHVPNPHGDFEATQSAQMARQRGYGDEAKKPPAILQQRTGSLDELRKDVPAAQQALVDTYGPIAQQNNARLVDPGPKKIDKDLEQKVAGEYGGDASRLTDLARVSMVAKSMEELRRLGGATRSGGLPVVNEKDNYANPKPNGYRDVNLKVATPNGHISEVQLHHEVMFEAKKKTDAIYHQVREIQRLAAQRPDGKGLTAEEQRRVVELQGQAAAINNAAWSRIQASEEGAPGPVMPPR